jgi:NAD+ kinase
MKSVAIVSKPDKPELSQVLPQLLRWVEQHGYKIFIDQETAAYHPPLGELVDRDEIGSRSPDFVIVLGGDGTLLSAARAVAASQIPILGVNLGSLGFLTEVLLSDLYSALEKIDSKQCAVDKRAMLNARLMRDGKCLVDCQTLNDAVLNKSAIARLASFDIYVDGAFVSNYRGDGLIVATPTGSTAYSLAAGGPVLVPSVEALVISPICPHSLSHRPLVVHDSAEIEILVQSATDQAFLSIDGQIGLPVKEGDRLICRKSPYCTHLFKLDQAFFDVLRAKLKWGQR